MAGVRSRRDLYYLEYYSPTTIHVPGSAAPTTHYLPLSTDYLPLSTYQDRLHALAQGHGAHRVNRKYETKGDDPFADAAGLDTQGQP